MPPEKSRRIAIIALIGLLVISAAVLRFMPADSPKSLNTLSIADQTSGPLDLTDKSVGLFMNNSSLLVLDLYYPGCGPCKLMNNTTSELSKELAGAVRFAKMNVKDKENSRTVKNYKISTYPTLLIFDEGILVSRMKGNISKSELLAELKDINPNLDECNVKLQPSGQAVTAATKTGAAAIQPQGKVLPLIELGAKNPSAAMLVTDDNIDSAISQYQPLLVVVGFTNPCPYCELFNVTLSELMSELSGQVAFAMIDTKPNIVTREKYNITGIPATLIFKDGKLAAMVQGNKNKATIVRKLKSIQPDLNTSRVSHPPPPPRLTPEQVCVNMTKSDRPLLQAFVVSRCPFGLQMQRIMADIIRESGETEEYLKVMYIGSVDTENNTIRAMHGEVEAQENLRQICIREEQSGKYWDYVSCYMKEGKTAQCLESAAIDVQELDACTNDSSRGLVYAQKDFDVADKFRVTGSPTMIMNDNIVKESDFATNTTNSRSPEAVKELLCCGFNEEPSFCTQELNESRAPTMFSAV